MSFGVATKLMASFGQLRLAWSGVAWPGLAWLGLPSFGLGRLGLPWPVSVLDFFARWRLRKGSCKIKCGRLRLRFRGSRKAKPDFLHSNLLRLVRTYVFWKLKLQRISPQRRDVLLISRKPVFEYDKKKRAGPREPGEADFLICWPSAIYELIFGNVCFIEVKRNISEWLLSGGVFS